MMVIGSGAREHAIVLNATASPFIEKGGLICVPGNAGIAQQARCYPVSTRKLDCLTFIAHQEKVDLTVVGPEQPLFDGIVDRFNAEGLTILGPTQKAAMMSEGSKAAFKMLCTKYHLPTATPYGIFSNVLEVKRYVQQQGVPIVIKADGPSRGKGVTVAFDLVSAFQAIENIMSTQAGRLVVIEKCLLPGKECSFMVVSDGKHILPLPPVRDYKTFYPGGPMTGGVACVSPVPEMTEKLQGRVIDRCVQPLLHALRKEGCPYKGVLYLGLMLRGSDFFMLEANCRLGDPESALLSFLVNNDLIPLFYAAATDSLNGFRLDYTYKPAVCTVLAAPGYPRLGSFGSRILGLEKAANIEGVKIFHAGTARREDGTYVTNGGRIVTIGANGKKAKQQIDQAIACISIEGGMRYRNDIGA